MFSFNFCVFILFLIKVSTDVSCESTVNECGDNGDCNSGQNDCNEPCNCNKAFIYNETTGNCTFHVDFTQTVVQKYDPKQTADNSESTMAKKIQAEADRIFKGILTSAVIFITCAGFCVVTACLYCCRINYTDYGLRKDVKALQKKVGRVQNQDKTTRKPKTEPIAESCPVVVDTVGLYVV